MTDIWTRKPEAWEVEGIDSLGGFAMLFIPPRRPVKFLWTTPEEQGKVWEEGAESSNSATERLLV